MILGVLMKRCVVLMIAFLLTGCSSLQWYDSPIPVKVDLHKSKNISLQKSAISDNVKQQNP